MKMPFALAAQAVSQINAQIIPEDHPVLPDLRRTFGDHTFFIGEEGLSIIEPAEVPEPGMQAGEVVKVACWHDDEHTTLAPQEPVATDIVVLLKPN